MEAKVISKDHIVNLLDQLVERYEVWAPVRQDDADGSSPVIFDRITAGRDAALDCANTTMSPKEAFFPHTETLFLFDGDQVTEPPSGGERVLFGVRPCDAGSLSMLDAVFESADYPTVYYGRRRENTFVVGIGCNRPLSTCFCTGVGLGPFNHEGMDVLLSDIGTKYVVQTLSEKGEKLLEGIPFLEEATPADLREQERVAHEARERIRSAVSIEGLKEKLDGMFDDPLWDEVAQKCVSCGACTFLCPTCHCFDILDEAEGDRGRRVRIWDSCQYPLFTHHTSGHNPRPSGTGRMRQRVLHKFHYFVENFDKTACVGCGRCVRSCPVNLDIRQVLNSIMER